MPFLAVTLLLLLNRRGEGHLHGADVAPEWRNGWVSDSLMGLCAVLFLALAVNELRNVLSPYLPFL